MGCDIHAMYERNHRIRNQIDLEFPWWKNKGDPELDRDYDLFGILAGVRCTPAEGPVAYPKFDKGDLAWKDPDFDSKCQNMIDGKFSSAFCGWLQTQWPDAHSVSFLTLKELKQYDQQKMPRMKGQFDRFTMQRWQQILYDLEALKNEARLTDDEVRIAFFFDN